MINDLYLNPSNHLNTDLSVQPYNYSSNDQRGKKQKLLCHETLVVISICNYEHSDV